MKRSVKVRRSVVPSPEKTGTPRLRVVSSRGAAPIAIKARDIELRRSASLEEAASAILSNALEQFAANRLVMQGSESERVRHDAVHQMRVALRRLRTAIKLLRSRIDGPALIAARDQAGAIAAMLGDARDWDLFLQAIEAGPRRFYHDASEFAAFRHALHQRRAQAHMKMRLRLNSRETTQFVAGFRRVILSKNWAAPDDARRKDSARRFAVTSLTRLHKRAKKKGAALATLSPKARHEARIALKKLRYGAEFFQSLFSNAGAARAFTGALAKIQDGLGDQNDIVTGRRLLDDVEAEKDAATLRASAFVRGWLAHAALAGDTDTQELEKRLRALKPFWL